LRIKSSPSLSALIHVSSRQISGYLFPVTVGFVVELSQLVILLLVPDFDLSLLDDLGLHLLDGLLLLYLLRDLLDLRALFKRLS
jgi:hypothetical protein